MRPFSSGMGIPHGSQMGMPLKPSSQAMYPNLWPVQQSVPGLMIDPSLFGFNHAAGMPQGGFSHAAGMPQVGMNQNFISLGNVLPLGLQHHGLGHHGWPQGDSVSGGRPMGELDISTTISKSETERKRNERCKTKDLWGKLDDLLPTNGTPRPPPLLLHAPHLMRRGWRVWQNRLARGAGGRCGLGAPSRSSSRRSPRRSPRTRAPSSAQSSPTVQ